jgi:hypothetical protein
MSESYHLDANGCRICPQCDSSIGVIVDRVVGAYCEDCGWPDSDFDEEGKQMEKERMEAKTLHNSDLSGTRENVPDVKVVGNGDMFQLLCKASSEKEGWMKSTKAMETPYGCIVQVTTQQRCPNGNYAVAEALTFVSGVRIKNDVNGGRKLV